MPGLRPKRKGVEEPLPERHSRWGEARTAADVAFTKQAPFQITRESLEGVRKPRLLVFDERGFAP
jgi:hypothetical protein